MGRGRFLLWPGATLALALFMFCLDFTLANRIDLIDGQIANGTAFPVDRFVVNLDLPPDQRWNDVIQKYGPQCRSTIKTLKDYIPSFVRPEVVEVANTIGDDLETYLGEHGLEIEGIAKGAGMPVGEVVIMNLFYELTALCTSIVAQKEDGHILHARNLDFGFGDSFTSQLQNITVQVDFQRGGKTLYSGATYAGYVGVLTGLSAGKFSISLNERLSWDILGNILEILENRNAAVASFLIREVLEAASDYPSALEVLRNHPLIADSYIIIAGVSAGQGAVITRARDGPVDVWELDANGGRWFELETNYDHWHAPPPWDDRRDPGNKAMEAMGRSDLSLEGMLNVLTIKPVLNQKTTYSALMAPYNGTFVTYRRTCPAPCPY